MIELCKHVEKHAIPSRKRSRYIHTVTSFQSEERGKSMMREWSNPLGELEVQSEPLHQCRALKDQNVNGNLFLKKKVKRNSDHALVPRLSY